MPDVATILEGWPQESREAAELVVQTYGEPDETTPSRLIWNRPGPWKRMVASRSFDPHHFPAPHHDSVTSVLDYRVPPERVSDLARFDGSVTVDRTVGEISARCHDEQANNLALNLAHDIVTGARSVAEAREYYATEFAGYRRGDPTPYMDALQFSPPQGGTGDPDERILSDADLEQAAAEGERRGSGD